MYCMHSVLICVVCMRIVLIIFIGCHRAGTSGRLMAGAEMKIDKPDE